MTYPCPCPQTDGQLMAAWSIIKVWGNPTLAEKFRLHASLHPTAADAAPTTTNEETQQ